jgi:hypothetical protein
MGIGWLLLILFHIESAFNQNLDGGQSDGATGTPEAAPRRRESSNRECTGHMTQNAPIAKSVSWGNRSLTLPPMPALHETSVDGLGSPAGGAWLAETDTKVLNNPSPTTVLMRPVQPARRVCFQSGVRAVIIESLLTVMFPPRGGTSIALPPTLPHANGHVGFHRRI